MVLEFIVTVLEAFSTVQVGVGSSFVLVVTLPLTSPCDGEEHVHFIWYCVLSSSLSKVYFLLLLFIHDLSSIQYLYSISSGIVFLIVQLASTVMLFVVSSVLASPFKILIQVLVSISL